MNAKPLNASCDNLIAYQLGKVAADAGSPDRRDVGDYIDRGLILLRLLREEGFDVYGPVPRDEEHQAIMTTSA
jgi:hypothetical protein